MTCHARRLTQSQLHFNRAHYTIIVRQHAAKKTSSGQMTMGQCWAKDPSPVESDTDGTASVSVSKMSSLSHFSVFFFFFHFCSQQLLLLAEPLPG